MIFERRYRPEVFRFDMDMENLVFERGPVPSRTTPLLGSTKADPADRQRHRLHARREVVFEPGHHGVRIRRHQTVLEVLTPAGQNPATPWMSRQHDHAGESIVRPTAPRH
jgi:hypothetical protein